MAKAAAWLQSEVRSRLTLRTTSGSRTTESGGVAWAEREVAASTAVSRALPCKADRIDIGDHFLVEAGHRPARPRGKFSVEAAEEGVPKDTDLEDGYANPADRLEGVSPQLTGGCGAGILKVCRRTGVFG